MTTNFARKVTVASLALAGMAASFAAFSAPSAAHADTSSRAGVGVLKSTDGGATSQAARTGSVYTVTFGGQLMGDDINIGVGELQECTTSKSMDSTKVDLAQFAINGNSADGAKGGNVEFEWKVEEGES